MVSLAGTDRMVWFVGPARTVSFVARMAVFTGVEDDTGKTEDDDMDVAFANSAVDSSTGLMTAFPVTMGPLRPVTTATDGMEDVETAAALVEFKAGATWTGTDVNELNLVETAVPMTALGEDTTVESATVEVAVPMTALGVVEESRAECREVDTTSTAIDDCCGKDNSVMTTANSVMVTVTGDGVAAVTVKGFTPMQLQALE